MCGSMYTIFPIAFICLTNYLNVKRVWLSKDLKSVRGKFNTLSVSYFILLNKKNKDTNDIDKNGSSNLILIQVVDIFQLITLTACTL